VEYKVVRSSRRSVALQISKDASLIVRCHHRFPLDEIERIITEKAEWILRKIEVMKAKLLQKPHFEFKDEHKIMALELFNNRAQYFASRIGLCYSKVRTTNAKSRWGSCGPTGTLSFNWHLIAAPMEVVDYVVAHEVCHLSERNHSKRFWEKVASIFPDYKKSRKWLKENGHLLTS